MNDNPPFPFRRGGFDAGPGYMHQLHQGQPALAWATFALVLLLVLAFFAVLIARTAAGRHHRRWHHKLALVGPGGPPDPLEFLRMRYARGEIDRDAFLLGTSDLTASAPTGEQPSG